MSITTIQLQKDTKARLDVFKAQHQLSSMDDVVRRLLDGHVVPLAAAGAMADPADAEDGEDNQRIPQLLSHTVVTRERRAVIHFCGLEPAAYEVCRQKLLAAVCVLFCGRVSPLGLIPSFTMAPLTDSQHLLPRSSAKKRQNAVGPTRDSTSATLTTGYCSFSCVCAGAILLKV